MGRPHPLPRTLVLALLLGAAACRKSEPLVEQNPAGPPNASADRLQKNERLPGAQFTFGIEVPRGMKLNYHYDDVAQLQGHVPVVNLAAYYRRFVNVAMVEMDANRAVFPRATINGDEKKRTFRIEIVTARGLTTVKLSDTTPVKAPEGLSEKERWERAGLNPDGTQKNPLQEF